MISTRLSHRMVVWLAAGCIVVVCSVLGSGIAQAGTGQAYPGGAGGVLYPPSAVSLSFAPTTAVEPGAGGEEVVADSVDRPVVAYIPIVLQPGEPPVESRTDVVVRQLLALVNEERIRSGCNPVAIEDRLAKAAQAHTQDMAQNGFISHQGTDDSWPHERVLRQGYQYSYVGESIAMTVRDSEKYVFSLWMDSPAHRAIILNCQAQEIGIGYALPYWTLVLASPL